jgi:ATP/maltotriose-dependent transcriptional regulator MalT
MELGAGTLAPVVTFTKDVAGTGRRNVLPRPGLYDYLDAAASDPVTVVVAPAGSGKTVLLRCWLD